MAHGSPEQVCQVRRCLLRKLELAKAPSVKHSTNSHLKICSSAVRVAGLSLRNTTKREFYFSFSRLCPTTANLTSPKVGCLGWRLRCLKT